MTDIILGKFSTALPRLSKTSVEKVDFTREQGKNQAIYKGDANPLC